MSDHQGASAQNFTTRTVASTVFLQSGELFELTGLRGKGKGTEDELARIDYVDFVKVGLGENGSNPEVKAPIGSCTEYPCRLLGKAIRI